MTIKRKCIITKIIRDRKNLFRINVTKNNNVSLDLEYKLQGRGYYISKDKEVIKKAKKILMKITKVELNEKIFTKMNDNL